MSRVVPQLISAINSGNPSLLLGGNVYSDMPPQDEEFPYLVMAIKSTSAWGTVDNCNPHVYVARLAVDILTFDRDTTEQLQESVEDLLTGYQSGSGELHTIQGITVDGGVSWEILEPNDGSDQFAFWANQEFLVHYKRAPFLIEV